MSYTVIITEETAANVVVTTQTFPITIEYNATSLTSGYGNAQVAALLSSFGSNTISTTGNVTAGYFLGNGSLLTGVVSSYGNAQVAALLSSFGSNTISTTGNITGGNISGTHLGSGAGLSNITGANVSGTVANAAFATTATTATTATFAGTANSVAGANVSGTVANATFATAAATAGTVTTNAQPNITSVGTLTGLTVTNTITGNITGSAGTAATAGTVTTNAQPNITSVGILTALSVSGNITGANVTGTHFGSGAALSSLTGANVTGTVANATFATSAGSAGTATSAVTAGTVTTAAQPNITSVGNLTGVTVSGTAAITTGNIGTLNVANDAIITGNLTVNGTTTTINSNTVTTNDLAIVLANNQSTSANINGAGVIAGSPAVASILYSHANTAWESNVAVNVTGNITAAAFIGSGQYLTAITGANVSGTVANATFATSAGVATFATTANAVAGANVSGTVANATFATSAGSATTATSATTAGTVTTNAQPNITSVGTLTSLSVTGNITSAGNISGNYILGNGSQLTGLAATYGNANVAANLAAFANNPISTTGNITAGNFFGNGSALSAITGANVTGTVANATFATSAATAASATSATTADTVTSNAQANITSVGVLTSLSSTGNITGANINGNGSGLSSITGANVSGTVANATFATNAGTATTATSATTAGTVTTNAQPNITSVGTLTSLSVSGNVTAGNVRSQHFDAVDSSGGALRNSAGTTQASWGAGGGSNFTVSVPTTISPANSQVQISPTGSGHVDIAPGSTGSINNMVIGNVTPAAVSATTVSATGNITGNYFIGNGSQLTGIATGLSGNMTGNINGQGFQISNLANLATTGTAWIGPARFQINNFSPSELGLTVDAFNTSSTVNVGGNLSAAAASVTGNVTAGNLTTAGQATVTGNITGGNILTAGLISATGAITGAAVTGTSLTVSTGNITAGNLLLSGAIEDSAQLDIRTTASNANIVFTPNGTGNVNMNTGLSVTGNSTVANVSMRASGANGINITSSGGNLVSNISGVQSGRIVFGDGWDGNLAHTGISTELNTSSRIVTLDKITLPQTQTNPARVAGMAGQLSIDLGGSTWTNKRASGYRFDLQLGNGTANTSNYNNIRSAAYNITVGNSSPSNIGNANIVSLAGVTSGVTIGDNSRVGNAITFVSIGAFGAGSNTVTSSQIGYSFTGGSGTAAGDNVIGFYVNGTTNRFGLPATANTARQATNYYAFMNDDPIAQMQLGSIRSAHTFTGVLSSQSGNITIDKVNGQTQILGLAANVTITGYANMVTSLSNGSTTKIQTDVLTIMVPPSPSTLTLPAASSTYKYFNGNATVPNSGSNWVKITVTATDNGGTVYLTTIEDFT